MSRTRIVCNMHWMPPRTFCDYIDANRDIFMPVCGGALLKGSDDEWVAKNVTMDDAEEDNISVLNPMLNEATALYLVYRNQHLLGDAENVGLCHYRRLFARSSLIALSECDGIISKPIPLYTAGFSTDIRTQYSLCHYKEDFEVLERTLSECGILDGRTWGEWCSLNRLYAPCNCNVMRREVWNAYCKDFFAVALKLPYAISVDGRDDYQKRACSFLMERFTSYWCYSMSATGRYRWRETTLEEHLDWKPPGATDKRGMTNGVFTGDQSMPKIRKWLLEKLNAGRMVHGKEI